MKATLAARSHGPASIMSRADPDGSVTVPTRATLVWATPRTRQSEWIRDLIGERLGGEVSHLGFDAPVRPGSIYVININRVSLSKVPPAFYRRVEQTPGVGILHLGDQWFGGEYEHYRHFSFVLRTHHSTRFRRPGTLTLPIGPLDGTPRRAEVRPASERPNLWCFLGKLISSRPELIREFEGLERGYVHTYTGACDSAEALTPVEYHRLLEDTVFAPCPMGNVMVETHRLYEALEAGGIPIIEDRPLLSYYEALLGPNPVPKFRTWRQARQFVQRMSQDPVALDSLQREIWSWWVECRARLRAETEMFVARGLRGDFRADAARYASYPTGWRHRVDQWAELAKHHSVEAGVRRALRMVRRRLAASRMLDTPVL